MLAQLLQLASRYFGPGANVVRWIAFPLACVVGTCGYYIETKYLRNNEKKFGYLEKSRIDERMQRQLDQEFQTKKYFK
uniref:ATP synthase subunit e, mitochondrial n=1 Tax=Meloidogyne hapla TaxID=6305 RepID=A0A1I8BY28_MELHA